ERDLNFGWCWRNLWRRYQGRQPGRPGGRGWFSHSRGHYRRRWRWCRNECRSGGWRWRRARPLFRFNRHFYRITVIALVANLIKGTNPEIIRTITHWFLGHVERIFSKSRAIRSKAFNGRPVNPILVILSQIRAFIR